MPWDTANYDAVQSWTGQDWTGPTARTLRIDPFLIWAEATNYRHLGGRPREWVPVILELKVDKAKPQNAPSAALALDQRPDNQGTASWIRINDWYRHPLPYLRDAAFCTAMVRQPFFEKLLTDATLQNAIVRFQLALPLVHADEIDTLPRPAPPVVAHRTNGAPQCIVAVIDDGIAFAHERFRGPNHTRIGFFWDQGPFQSDLAPEYGRDLTNAAIDQLVQQHTHGAIVDEDSLYASLGYIESRRRAAHGTFVLDAAAGFESSDVPAGAPEIIAVQLQTPSRRTRDRSAAWLSARVLDGLRYVLHCEQIVASGHAPLVVNLSFGNIAGPHDGSSMLECALDDLITLRQAQGPFETVIAAGNSNLVRARAHFDVPGGRTRDYTLRVSPDDPTPTFLEIWLDPTSSSNDGGEFVITTPYGESCVPMKEGSIRVWRSGGEAVCTAVYLRRVAAGDRALLLVAVSPTVAKGAARATAPAGDWRIAVRNLNAKQAVSMDAWIERDETPWDFPQHGRQSRFFDTNYERFEKRGGGQGPAGPGTAGAPGRTRGRGQGQGPGQAQGPRHRPHGGDKDDDVGSTSHIRRAGTINSIATGSLTIAVGAFHAAKGRPAPYSSSGPGLPAQAPKKTGPDAAALGDLSSARPGIIGAGSRSGSAALINGTSVAAAAITRLIADLMQQFRWNGRATLQEIAAASETQHAADFAEYPQVPARVGAGRIITDVINNGRQGKKVTR